MKPRFLCILFLGLVSTLQAQTDSLEQSQMLHQQKTRVRFATDSMVIDSLSDEVVFYQDNVVLYCDSSVIIDEFDILAWGNVVLVHHDTIEAFCDSLRYNAQTKQSRLIRNVVLRSSTVQLVTDELHYDLNTEIAQFHEGAEMRKGDLRLRSEKGTYYVDQKKASFRKEVEVVDSLFVMWTDSLNYDLEADRADFYGPTRIDQDSARLYCELGHYDIPDKSARLMINAQYQSDSLVASADELFYDGQSKEIVLQNNAKFRNASSYGESIQIVYNEKSKASVLTGEAYIISEDSRVRADVIEHHGVDNSFSTRGRMELIEKEQVLKAGKYHSDPSSVVDIATEEVVWEDTIEQLFLASDSLFINDEESNVVARNETARPLLRKINGQDTIWMSSEEIEASEVSDSAVYKIFEARKDVRVLSSRFQAVSELLHFHSMDSILSLSSNPLLWVDSTQFSADSLDMHMLNDEPSIVYMKSNAFIISQSFPTVFDQIKGKNVTVWLTEGQIDSMHVKGNAESLYFMKDDKSAFLGADKTECSEIMFYFNEGKMERIESITKPTSVFLPMQSINLQELKLSGFGWFIEKRPIWLSDLNVQAAHVHK